MPQLPLRQTRRQPAWTALERRLGAQSGCAEGFNYSPIVKDTAVVWDEANLDKMIADPEAFLPGNSMKPYPGIPDAGSRKTIIEYLKGK